MFDEPAAPPLEHVDVLGAGVAALRARQRALRPRAVGRRDRLPGARLHRAAPQPDRRRADDVRAGQQRALPAQDLQRALHDRRRRAGPLDVRDDPPHPRDGAAAHRRRVQRQRVGDGGRRDRALAAGGLHQRAAVPRPARDGARADEGRDAQPPDRDLAVPRGVDRRRRRDPRRGRDRARLAAEGRADRLQRLEPAPARTPTSRGSASATAGPTTSRARCRS